MAHTLLLLAGVMGLPGQVGPQMPTGSARPAAEAPAAVELGPENLHRFDPSDLRVVWNNRRWQLVSRNELIKDFGPRDQEARLALRVLRELRVNQHVVIGTPHPVVEYWLADGQPPQGAVPSGVRTVPLNPAGLRVEQVQGQWCLRDGPRVLFTFGPREADAQQALAAIRKYQFDQVGLVGGWSPSLYVFLRRNDPATPSLAAQPRNPTKSLTPPRFSRLAKGPDGNPRFEKPKTPSPLAGLEAVVQPTLPPLNPLGARPGEPARDLGWRTQPRVGPATPVVDLATGRVPFDWRQVQVRQDKGEWKLMAGSLVLANFGTALHDARLALSALRHYRFAEQWRLGGDQPYLTYYTASNAAPHGVLLGVAATELKPEQLQVRQVENGYALCQGTQVVLRLRDREEDGRKLLETIRKNRLDRLCRIGEPGKETMTFLVRTR